MKFAPSISSRSMPAIITLLVLGAIFGYYFLLYIPGQKRHIVRTNYKVLQKSGAFIKARYFDYSKPQKIDDCEALLKAKNQNVNNTDQFDIFETIAISPDSCNNCSDESILNVLFSDSLISSKIGFVSSQTREIKIAEVPYILFVHQENVKTTYQKCINKIFFCGLIEKEKFNRMTRRVSSWIIVNAAILILLLLMGMPLLKLIFLSPIERLNRINITWLGVSVILGSGLLIIFALSNYLNLNTNEVIDIRLDSLSSQISTSFTKEIEEGYDLLDKYDTLNLKCSSCLSAGKPGNENVRDTFYIQDGSNTELHYDTIRIDNLKLISLFWIKESGEMQTYISKDKNQIYGLDVSTRDYFVNIVKNRKWSFPGHPNKKFAFQSIVSWRTGKHLAIISKESTSKLLMINELQDSVQMNVIALSTHLSSVMDPLLMKGYGFVVIDEQGKVLFHSNKKNNLNENFFDEIDHSQNIISAVSARVASKNKVKYRHRDSKILVKPIDGFPLSIATFYDLSAQRARIVQLLSTTYVLYLLSLLFIGIQLLILSVIAHRHSKLKKKRFFLKWLLPNKEMTPRYHMLLFANVVIILFLAVVTCAFFYLEFSSKFYYTLDPVFIIIVTQFYLLAFIYFLLNFTVADRFEIPDIEGKVLPPKSNRQTMLEYATSMFKRSKNLEQGINFAIYSFVFIVLFNILYLWKYESSAVIILSYQIVLILIMGIILRLVWNVNHMTSVGIHSRVSSFIKILKNPYPAFILSWLVLGTIVPTFYFYKFSAAAEFKIWSKYLQVELGKEYDNRKDKIYTTLGFANGEQNDFRITLDSIIIEGQYHKPYYKVDVLEHNDWKEIVSISETSDSKITPEKYYDELQTLSLIKQDEDGKFPEEFVRNKADDLSWNYIRDSLKMVYASADSKLIFSPTSNIKTFNRNIKYRLLFLIILGVSIWIMYRIISFSIHRIFATDYKNYIVSRDDNLEFFINRKLNTRIFLTRMEHASSVESLSNYISYLNNEAIKYVQINLVEISDDKFINSIAPFIRKSEVLIVRNFEYLSNNHISWDKKMELFNLVEKEDPYKNKQIIISSHEHPLLVIKYYETMLEKTSSQKWDPNFREEYQEYRYACSQWRKFFDSYVKLSEPIRNERFTYDPKMKYLDPELETFVKEELTYGTYLSKLEPLVHAYYTELHKQNGQVEVDDLILKIESLAEPYYYSLWSSLSKEERFLVFDLAKDGFVNIKNSRGIHMLLEKGIFIYENNLRLINQSFNNFILSVIDKAMEDEMKKELNLKGSWRIAKNVLLIIVIAIVGFIALSAPDLMNNVNAIIGAVMAILGLLLRSNVLFSSTSSPG